MGCQLVYIHNFGCANHHAVVWTLIGSSHQHWFTPPPPPEQPCSTIRIDFSNFRTDHLVWIINQNIIELKMEQNLTQGITQQKHATHTHPKPREKEKEREA